MQHQIIFFRDLEKSHHETRRVQFMYTYGEVKGRVDSGDYSRHLYVGSNEKVVDSIKKIKKAVPNNV